MKDPHGQVEPFFDGKLSPEEADAFRRHYATCEECDRRLGELMAMDVLLEDRRQRAPVSRPLPKEEGFLQRFRWFTPTLAGAVALAAVLVVVRPGNPSQSLEGLSAVAMHPDPKGRVIDGRSAYLAARGYQQPMSGQLGATRIQVPPPPPEDLARLEHQHDQLGKAAVYLVRGQLPDVALDFLKPLSGPDAESERALAYLVRDNRDAGDLEEAVRRADAALAADPTHDPAQWNKALALKELGLKLLAANSFAAVKDGWAGEAQKHAGELRDDVKKIQTNADEAMAAGKKLLNTGEIPDGRFLKFPDLRRYFYEAVRTKTSREDVDKLMPLAERLDAQHHQSYARDYVKWVARRDFGTRRALAEKYARLIRGDTSLNRVKAIADLWSSGEDDLAVGAMAQSGGEVVAGPELDRFEARCKEIGDPWFTILGHLRRASASQVSAEDATEALEEALATAHEAHLDYRETQAATALLGRYVKDGKLDKARELAMSAWKLVSDDGDWINQLEILMQLGQLGRLREDVPLARAYLQEAEARAGTEMPTVTRSSEENQAFLESTALDAAAARRHLQAALATKLPLTAIGAFALADVARMKPDPADEAVMEAFRANVKPSDPQYPLALHAYGRWKIATDPGAGRKLIRESIALTDKEPPSDFTRRVRTYGYTSLIMDEGKNGAFDKALALVEEELGDAKVPSCAVVLTTDSERSLVLVRGPSGLDGEFDGARKQARPSNLTDLVSPRLRTLLNGCPEVKVIARPPLVGRPGALPSDIAWSYRLLEKKGPTEPPPSAPRSHLVVQRAELSARRLGQLTQLQDWLKPGDHPELTFLTGPRATPSAVLDAMKTADQVDIVTHAMVNPNSGETSLILAEDPGGEDQLSASQFHPGMLEKHPLVMLVACEAAVPAPVFWEAHSLPSKIIDSGARAVLAASDPIPADDGPKFFDDVRQRIQRGAAPAVALRDARLAWRGGGVRNWVESVLLFE